MDSKFLIRPDLYQLTKLLSTTKTLPSIQKLVTMFNSSPNKIRTIQKELLYFKFIYAKSSKNYTVNDWTTRILNSPYTFEKNDEFYIFKAQDNFSCIQFNIKKIKKLFNVTISSLDTYSGYDLLYLFIIMSKLNKSIHKNKIYIDDGKLVLKTLVQEFKNKTTVCIFQYKFTETMNWNS